MLDNEPKLDERRLDVLENQVEARAKLLGA